MYLLTSQIFFFNFQYNNTEVYPLLFIVMMKIFINIDKSLNDKISSSKEKKKKEIKPTGSLSLNISER